jgi:hypothetical protein
VNLQPIPSHSWLALTSTLKEIVIAKASASTPMANPTLGKSLLRADLRKAMQNKNTWRRSVFMFRLKEWPRKESNLTPLVKSSLRPSLSGEDLADPIKEGVVGAARVSRQGCVHDKVTPRHAYLKHRVVIHCRGTSRASEPKKCFTNNACMDGHNLLAALARLKLSGHY